MEGKVTWIIDGNEEGKKEQKDERQENMSDG